MYFIKNHSNLKSIKFLEENHAKCVYNIISSFEMYHLEIVKRKNQSLDGVMLL